MYTFKRLKGYHGWLGAGAIKDYCKANNLHFLYQYIDQFSSSYWCKMRLELLTRVCPLDEKSIDKELFDPNYRNRIELMGINTAEIRRLDKVIRHRSFDNLIEKLGGTWAYTESGRITDKYIAHSDWAEQAIL